MANRYYSEVSKYPVELFGDIGSIERAISLKKNRRLIKDYGITYIDYLAMYEEQEGCCAICKKPSPHKERDLSVDHCHESGKVRGLLCLHCNTALGHFKDNIDSLGEGIIYLVKRGL